MSNEKLSADTHDSSDRDKKKPTRWISIEQVVWQQEKMFFLVTSKWNK
jgi:hypothetical protein